MAQLHKKFTDKQIEQFIKRYLNKEIERKYIEKILDIKLANCFVEFSYFLLLKTKTVSFCKYFLI